MKQNKLLSIALVAFMMALAGCSSTSGGGSEPPSNVTVVTPPAN